MNPAFGRLHISLAFGRLYMSLAFGRLWMRFWHCHSRLALFQLLPYQTELIYISSGTFQLTPTSTYPQLTVIVSYSDQRAPQLAISTPLSTQDEFGDLITEAGAGPQASFIDDLKAAKLDSGCKAKVVFQPIHRR